MSQANALEQSMLDLINAERAAVGVAPLVFNDMLNDSSEDHSSWMLNADQFSHTGDNGSSAHERIMDAGYEFEGQYSSGENIAFQSERGAEGLEDDVLSLHEGLMDSPGHRANILNPNFKEIGVGIERGDFSQGGTSFDAVMATQNFAMSEADNSSTVMDDPVETPTDAEDMPVADDPSTGDDPDMVADAGDEDTPDTPAVEEEPDADDVPDVTADAGDEDTTDAPVMDDDQDADDPTDVTADAGDEDTTDTPVMDDDQDVEDPTDVTADAGDDVVEDTPTNTDDQSTDDDTQDDAAEGDVDMPGDGFEFDGDLYFVNIGELNFDFECGGDDTDTTMVADTDAETDAGDTGDAGDANDTDETSDDTTDGEFDMAMFVQQLTDLLDEYFGDACNCSEMA